MSDPTQDILRGDALHGLKTHQGYKVLIDEIIYPIYRDAIQDLKDDFNSDKTLVARATIKAIDDIIAKIDDKINFAEQLAKEVRENFDKHTQGTSE